MSLSEPELERRETLRAGSKVMSGLNPSQRDELRELEEDKWRGVDPLAMVKESQLEVVRVSRKDPYEFWGYDFVLVAELDGIEYVFSGDYDTNRIEISPAELDEVTTRYEPEQDIRTDVQLYESLLEELNESIYWKKLD